MTSTLPIPELVANGLAGFWKVFVYPRGDNATNAVVDVSFVRGAPTSVESLSTSDPFGPTTASVVFPAITLLDRAGSGDLWWLTPEVDIDICWFVGEGEPPVYRWEGYMSIFEYSSNDVGGSLTVTCRGAMYQLDNYLAKPSYVYQPIPYEVAISRQFDNKPDLRVAPVQVEWPAWWNTRFALADYSSKPLYLRPEGVEDGANWSGLVTRTTGSFTPTLTEYIQGLLGNMYSAKGQFTLLMNEGRRPVLRHRDYLSAPLPDTLVVDLLNPGVTMGLQRDYTKQVNVVYAQGKALNGSTYSGMRTNADGTMVTYEPYAYRRSVHPLELNDWYDRNVMRKEVNLSFYEGMSELEAQQVSRSHLQRFADPGYFGSIDLTSDPLIYGSDPATPEFFPRYLIRAGMSILVRGLFGDRDGQLFHITECTVSNEATSLTIDSKFRDQLTVQEVRMNTRDALAPVRLLTVGQYRPNIPDMLFPWSYLDGSGFMPKGSQTLFDGMPDNIPFPWSDWTRQRPPRDPQWSNMYIKIGPTDTNADNNWANKRQTVRDFEPYSVRMSQAGEAQLIQVAAYDQYGNVLKVPFHVSLYKTNGVRYSSMPALGLEDEPNFPPYKAGQHYPFFPKAWEQYAEDGTALNPETAAAAVTAQVIVGYGNYYEKAGFWPGSSAVEGAEPTGLFVDESGFSWDLTDSTTGVNPMRPREINLQNPNAADLYIMIYCDAQLTQDVYFLGRIFRKEPGTA